MTAFADLGDMPEDERLEVIGITAEAGAQVAFVVDDMPKADRYVAKLKDAGYKIQEVSRCKGPNGTVIVRVGPKMH
jgi:hypothetical protein